MARVVVAVSQASGWTSRRGIWPSNFAQSVRWWRRRGVGVGRSMFKVVTVTAWSDVPPDPVSQDQFQVMVVAWPLVHVRSMMVGLFLSCM